MAAIRGPQEDKLPARLLALDVGESIAEAVVFDPDTSPKATIAPAIEEVRARIQKAVVRAKAFAGSDRRMIPEFRINRGSFRTDTWDVAACIVATRIA